MLRNELKKVTELKEKYVAKKQLLIEIKKNIQTLAGYRSIWQIKIWRRGARDLKKELNDIKRELELHNINPKDL